MSDAQQSGAETTNTKYVQLTAEVPRDPGQYRRTDHARQRQRYRTDPEVKPWIIEEVIETGTVRGTNDVGVATPEHDSHDHFARFTFTAEVWSEGIHEWTVVVGLRQSGFLADDTHDIITAYCGCHGQRTPDCDRQEAP